jgi:hypothetical protein
MFRPDELDARRSRAPRNDGSRRPNLRVTSVGKSNGWGRYHGSIIDDLGYLQRSRDDMEVVFTLLAERYEHGRVLMTSNLPFSKSEFA